MNTILLSLALLALTLLCLPALALLVLTLVSIGRRDPRLPVLPGPRPPLAVLVPAHNESAHLAPTLANLQAQLAPGDRLLVVADNCDDDTAECARRAGAEVVERHDRSRRGKGYALAHGVAHLSRCPPGMVLVVDADCQLSPGALERDRKSTRLNSSHSQQSRMPSSA